MVALFGIQGIVADPNINWSMETPGNSADGLGDTQAPFLELENADHQMLEPRGPCWLVFLLSVCENVLEQGQRASGSAPGGAGAAATMGKVHKLTRRPLVKDE